MRTADVETAAIGLLSRVVVRGRTSVGCRPVVAPEGRVIERGGGGRVGTPSRGGGRGWAGPGGRGTTEGRERSGEGAPGGGLPPCLFLEKMRGSFHDDGICSAAARSLER